MKHHAAKTFPVIRTSATVSQDIQADTAKLVNIRITRLISSSSSSCSKIRVYIRRTYVVQLNTEQNHTFL